ncbi:glycoside hydrolase family 66 protein [uncultured Bacteroides sp.]|uniref:glycoside hydrolase family 66 protein n=1 Tax=uncultured Bacteroides sp. TaxID=162156 RepID=UPI00263488C1|nr:glycoside hydrolase family 66 protein [uncultured Bacteroides sp.]
MRRITYILLSAALVLGSCIDEVDSSVNPITYGDGYMEVYLSTDKAAYIPGEEVKIKLNKMVEGNATIRYRHLNQVIEETPLTSNEWSWNPPTDDYKGYMVDIYTIENGVEVIKGSIAIDVSSDPKMFPRNGFLSEYGKMSESEINKVMDNLNRYHINYVQYQDWHYKHHMPLAGSVSAPMEVWKDIINRDCYRTTVDGYIKAGHERNMKSLFYNLAYGALSDAEEDGVSEEWYMFKDDNHGTIDAHILGSPFKSSIYLTNPGNDGWIDYIGQKTSDVYDVYDFDGYQIDQLGGRGTLYDYRGDVIDYESGFTKFIKAMKNKEPEKRLVMNAVGGFGGQKIADSESTDFFYVEVWDKPTDRGFEVISNTITGQDNLDKNGGRKTILAAYMNYDFGKIGRSYFNTPGVLMANAAIHAWGGAHLELGEHMLCNEYFPNSNLTMNGELKKSMITFYDFITAYENLLRDGGNAWTGVDAVSLTGEINFNQWPPQKGNVATVGKNLDDGKTSVVHLLNYTNAIHLDWCDTNADQQEQDLIENKEIELSIDGRSGTIKSVWCASPDFDFGVPRTLEFTQNSDKIKLTLPALKYWTMIVVEYE